MWGKAKREINALKSEIVVLLNNGATLKEAYEVLSGAGRLSVGASTFFRHAALFRDELQAPKPAQAPVELTPQVLAWLREASKLMQPADPQTTPLQLAMSPDSQAAAETPAVARRNETGSASTAVGPQAAEARLPGQGTELRRFKASKSGEKDHWS